MPAGETLNKTTHHQDLENCNLVTESRGWGWLGQTPHHKKLHHTVIGVVDYDAGTQNIQNLLSDSKSESEFAMRITA